MNAIAKITISFIAYLQCLVLCIWIMELPTYPAAFLAIFPCLPAILDKQCQITDSESSSET